MSGLWRWLGRCLCALLVWMLAIALMIVFNLTAGWWADHAGGVQGSPRLLFDLLSYLLSGLTSATVLSWLPRRHWHLRGWLTWLLLVALWACWRMGGDWPSWFVIGLLLGVPLQAWCLRRWLWPSHTRASA